MKFFLVPVIITLLLLSGRSSDAQQTNVYDATVMIEEGNKDQLRQGCTSEFRDSRFQRECAQLVIKTNLNAKGAKDTPIIITFKDKPLDGKEPNIKSINIDKESLVYLPAETRIVEYMPQKYIQNDFEVEIKEHSFKGLPYYAFLFGLGALAYSSK